MGPHTRTPTITLLAALAAAALAVAPRPTSAAQEVRDTDGDQVVDEVDNCLEVANPDQTDFEGDGLGDACDPDVDGDVVPDTIDNCPRVYNMAQENADDDELGDACDEDDDNDGLEDVVELELRTDPTLGDSDGDGYGDRVEVNVGTSPLSEEDYPGHERPAGGFYDGPAGCGAGRGGGDGVFALAVLVGAATFSRARRRARAGAMTAALLALLATTPSAARAESFETRAAPAGLEGPYGDLAPAVRGATRHFSFATRYRYLREPLTYRRRGGDVYCTPVEVDHAGSFDVRARITERLALLLGSEWTIARSGCGGFDEVQEGGLGDLSLGIALYAPPKDRTSDEPLELHHAVYLYWLLPVGDAAAFRGDGQTGGGLLASTELVGRWFGLIANLGFELRHRDVDVETVGLFRYGVGVAAYLPRRLVGFAVQWTGGVVTDGDAYTSGLGFSVSHEQESWFLRLNAGTDLTLGGPGASPFRLFVDTGFSL